MTRPSVCFLVALVTNAAEAHPVVFANGTAIMGHHQGEMSEFEIVHSPSARTGLGLSIDRHDQSTQLLGKASALLWRGNFPDYQSNFYFGLGLGRRWSSDSGNQPNNHAHESHSKNISSAAPLYQWSVVWDGEDREIYSSVKFTQTFESKDNRTEQGKIRLGLAPYAAQSDELTFWGMVEWSPEKSSQQSRWRHEVTPLIRIFYKNALLEVGSSINGRFLFNYMFHFFQ